MTSVVTGFRLGLMVCAGIAAVLMGLRARRRRKDVSMVLATASLEMFNAFALVVQIRQLGHPLKTWWGTPTLAAGVPLSLASFTKTKS